MLIVIVRTLISNYDILLFSSIIFQLNTNLILVFFDFNLFFIWLASLGNKSKSIISTVFLSSFDSITIFYIIKILNYYFKNILYFINTWLSYFYQKKITIYSLTNLKIINLFFKDA